MKKFLIFLFSILFYGFSNAQFLDTDQTGNFADVEYLVKNVLMNPAVSAQMNVSNIKLNGVAVPTGTPTTNSEIGYFSNFSSTTTPLAPAVGFGNIQTGLFMSTGEASLLDNSGGGTPSPLPVDVDNHLTFQLEGVGVPSGIAENLRNLTTIEFDFVAAGSSVSFDYIFGSTEYNGFTCDNFNDIFGFFISGPGINGDLNPVDGIPDLGTEIVAGLPYHVYNMAKVPSLTTAGVYTNTPVVINTINGGTPTGAGQLANCTGIDPNFAAYSVYFVQNNQGTGVPSNIGLNGHTTLLTAFANVQCGETYHMKLAIADVSDPSFNSAVLLREGSFSIASGSTDIASEFNLSDSIIIEGCYPGEVIVKINDINPGGPTDILIDVSGVATEGIDYVDIPDMVSIPAGDSTVSIMVNSIVDAIQEGNESVIITTKVCESIISRDTLWIQDPAPLEVNVPNDTLVCDNSPAPIVVSAVTGEGYAPYSFEWFYEGVSEGVNQTISINAANGGEHICVVTDDCGHSYSDTFVVNHFPPTPEATFTSFFNIETDQIIEGCEYGNLTFTLINPLEHDTTLDFQIVGGNAVEGTDYYELPTSVTIPAGDLTAIVPIEAIVDGQFEDDETIQIYFPFYNGCSTAPNPLVLTILSNPNVNVELDDSIFICRGDEFTIEPNVIGGIEAYSYEWTNTIGGVWNVEDLNYTGDSTLMYYLTVKDACEYEAMDSIVVVAPFVEEIVIDPSLPSSYTICKDDDLFLEPDFEGGNGRYSYEWRKDGIAISGERNLLIEYPVVAENIYQFTVTDSCGFTNSKLITVRVEHCEIPNVFTPNDDNLNDLFVFESGEDENSLKVSILDRWGDLVFKSETYENCNRNGIGCWDGLDKDNEKPCEEGIYFYIIEYNDGRTLKGTFHLMR